MIWEKKFPIIKNIIKKLRLSIDIKRRSILRGSTLIENLSDCRNVLHFNTRNVCKPVSGYGRFCSFTESTPGRTSQTIS